MKGLGAENRILIARIEEKTLDNQVGHSIVFHISIEIHCNAWLKRLTDSFSKDLTKSIVGSINLGI